MNKREIISWVFNGVLIAVISGVVPFALEFWKEKHDLKIQNEYKDRLIKNLVTELEQSIEYRYDEYGNYVKETTTHKKEVEVIIKAKQQTENELMAKNDSLLNELKRVDDLPRLETIKAYAI